MRIILDECVPSLVRTGLPHHDIATVQYKGWAGIKNGELLRLVTGEFDVFVTSDKNLKFQQNLSKLRIAVILLPSNQVPALRAILPRIDTALANIALGEILEI
jgi:hypothetical protein